MSSRQLVRDRRVEREANVESTGDEGGVDRYGKDARKDEDRPEEERDG